MRHLTYVTDPTTGRVWPVPAGGSDDAAPEGDAPQGDADGQQDAPDGEGSDADDGAGSKRAVLEDLAKERRRRQELEQALADREAADEERRQAEMSDHERAIEQARKEAAEQTRSEVLGDVNQRLFAAEVKAAAASKVSDPDLLNDPDVAKRLLGFDDFPTSDDGQMDSAAIAKAIDDLVASKPYLQAGERQQVPGADQGSRGGNRVTQLTREQFQRLSPEARLEAENNGQIDRLLGRI